MTDHVSHLKMCASYLRANSSEKDWRTRMTSSGLYLKKNYSSNNSENGLEEAMIEAKKSYKALQQSRHEIKLALSNLSSWRRKWQPTPVFLPGESQGQRSLVGCRLRVAQSRTRMKQLSSSSSSSKETGKPCTDCSSSGDGENWQLDILKCWVSGSQWLTGWGGRGDQPP